MTVLKATPSDETYPPFQRAFDVFNRELFEGQLPPVLLTLQRKANTCGYLSPNRFANRDGALAHELAMNPEWFAVTPLVEILQTLVHEMVHLWQHVHGTPARGRFHNREWGAKLESLGLMPSHTGQPGGKRTGDCMSDYPIAGGRFLQVVRDLVADNFAIAWYDRFPPSRAVASPATETIQLAALSLPASATLIPSSSGVVSTMERPAKPTNTSNRVKYQCGGCRHNLWGKPGLAFTCDTCGMPFHTEAEAE